MSVYEGLLLPGPKELRCAERMWALREHGEAVEEVLAAAEGWASAPRACADPAAPMLPQDQRLAQAVLRLRAAKRGKEGP